MVGDGRIPAALDRLGRAGRNASIADLHRLAVGDVQNDGDDVLSVAVHGLAVPPENSIRQAGLVLRHHEGL